ncbi:hypothetical protein PLICRDRAFT_36348 [Plicaturopsis crispa FD-325 SS-3]|nr:hypothetical protein PLICRDRAFT_36348 [Plicaturopsis crispa FD-325 SS-3]
MSGYSGFAKQVQSAFNREKPHSSITDWVTILTSPGYEDEAYDGIPELVDSINLQAASGPTEASRALRKKLKHGDSHQQYRALVILKALVENCGHKFQTTFADGQLTDALKTLAQDPGTDHKVKKKLIAVLASWNNQFKNDPSMTLVAGLYKQCRPADRRSVPPDLSLFAPDPETVRRQLEKEEAKKKAKAEKEEAKERARREEEEARKRREREKRNKGKTRAPFDFEKEKPNVLSSIANASQASSNLVNAITLVNPEADSLQTNTRVQECLTRAKQSRKQIVRYIQLVENEELIGTLIETNERIIAALEMYDQLSSPTPANVSDITKGLAAANIDLPEREVDKLQERQRTAVERARRDGTIGRGKGKEDPYADLQDLSFGPLGADQRNLPPPLDPTAPSGGNSYEDRGSLSDFSDYESSDEETHKQASTSNARRAYVDVSDDESEERAHSRAQASGVQRGALVDVEDPFADPFAG